MPVKSYTWGITRAYLRAATLKELAELLDGLTPTRIAEAIELMRPGAKQIIAEHLTPPKRTA